MPPRQRAVKGSGNESAPWPERLSTAYALFLAGKAQRSYYRVYVPSCTATCVLLGAPVVSLKRSQESHITLASLLSLAPSLQVELRDGVPAMARQPSRTRPLVRSTLSAGRG